MKSLIFSSTIIYIFAIFVVAGISLLLLTNKAKAQVEPPKPIELTHPEWVANANIYEVNLRQYTPEGTIKAFIPHMQRLKDMGVDILWLMPISPIGEKNRKGSLGSYYAVKDYLAVNPEFGTMKDFKALVKKAHGLKMKVIIDWVANHSAWDNQLVTDHPDWYAKDEKGNLVSPFDWTDVLQFDYSKNDLREYMWKALEFWVKEAGIDGYRCDVADKVPVDFWNTARMRLDKIKPVFMLAEAENPNYITNAFDMDYGWNLHRLSNEIAKGEKNCTDLDKYFVELGNKYPKGAIKMNFTSNHDENSWQGTEYERYGEGAKAMAVLMATLPGMPLIYSGQESELKKRLKFFERDPIEWGNFPLAGFYKTLLELKHRNKALWNGTLGGELTKVKTSADQDVYAFSREKDGDKVLVILNLSPKSQKVTFKGDVLTGSYLEVFTKNEVAFDSESTLDIEAWSFKVYESR